MKYDEFIGQVQNRARLASRGDAERAARATLATLTERLAGGEAKDFISQLPGELGEQIALETVGAGIGERFSPNEFFRRVGIREGTELPQATFHARAVIDVLKEAISAGELKDIRSQLPPEFNRLFESGSEGSM